MGDRTVLISGGAGGLGSAVVAAFADAGWRVVAPDLTPGGEEREGVERVTADLTDPDDVARAFRSAAGRPEAPLRSVAHLIGGYAGDQPVASTPLADFEAQFALNLRPAYLICQAALPRLAASGGGAICCVSSRAALEPFAGAAGYCASKAALIAFARVVAREGAGDGIRCNVVLPSQIGTRAMLAQTPPERHGSLVPPPEIAQVIRFLCGEESAPVSGAAVPVYGGPA
jgi:NAD(P)-dependent dehydrogenase (short-subunit alcohol dehydrogenase family)